MKKTNKVHPITAFRKANEARQSVVKKSLKKAQDGIETNDDMINKAGSTGGYKKPANWWAQDAINLSKGKPWEDTVKLMQSANAENVELDRMDQMKRVKEAKMSDFDVYRNSITNKPKLRTSMMDSLYPKKKGGAVKRKK